MSRILEAGLLALALCNVSALAQDKAGHAQGTTKKQGGGGACKAAQANWTQAQKDERDAFARYYTGDNEVKHGVNKENQGQSQENAGKRRQQTDPHGQQGKQMENAGKSMQAAGKQQQRDGKAKMSGAEKDLHAAWKRELAEGSASVRDATGCGGPTRPAKI